MRRRHHPFRAAVRTPLASVLVLVLASSLLAAQSSPASEEANPFRDLLPRADVLVTVKFLLGIAMPGARTEREREREITCVTIDPEGLVLCSNTELAGYVNVMSRLGGVAGMRITATPREIEVLFGDAAEGVEASLLARDTDRDLAWLRLEGEAPKPLPFLDLADAAEAQPGDEFYLLRRLDKFFGRAPLVQRGVIGTVVAKPRRLLVPADPKAGGFGLPVYTASGQVLGVTVLQMPGLEDAGPIDVNLMSLGSAAKVQEMLGGLILPAAEVVRATRLAREVAAEDEE